MKTINFIKIFIRTQGFGATNKLPESETNIRSDLKTRRNEHGRRPAVITYNERRC